jgi:hypothetical protein
MFEATWRLLLMKDLATFSSLANLTPWHVMRLETKAAR